MPSYLVRRPSGWHFRIRVPQDLQPLLARRELRCSLARHDALEAARLARHLYCGADRIFRRLRARARQQQPMNDTEIHHLLDQHLRELLADTEEDRAVSGPIDRWVQEHEQHDFEHIRESSQEALARNDLADATWEVDKLLSKQEIKLEPDSPAYKKLCRGMLSTRAQLAEIEVARCQGDYSKDLAAVAPVAPSRTQVETTDPDAPKVSELRDKYLDDGYKSKVCADLERFATLEHKRCPVLRVTVGQRCTYTAASQRHPLAYREHLRYQLSP